jgi:SAM-dependent methyltransferase
MPLPEGPWLNVGSGPTNAAGWTHLDGSWQTRLSGYRWLLPLGRMFLKKEIGHWPTAVKYCDVRRGLGFGPNTVAVVYSSHMLEHLHRADALRFLREVHRTLKPGGACRILVPDVEAIVRWYQDHQREVAANTASIPAPGDRSANGGKGSSSDLLMDMLLLRPRELPAGRGPATWLKRAATLHEHKWMYDAEGLRALFKEAGFANAEPRRFLDSALPAAQLQGVEAADRICDGAGVCVEARK